MVVQHDSAGSSTSESTRWGIVSPRYTLAVRRLEDGDTASSVLAEFLGILDGLDLSVKAVYLNHRFYDSKCLTLLQAHNHAYVMSIVRWGVTIKQELSEGWSRVIQHDLTAKLDGHSWTVEFPVYIDWTYQNGRYDEHGVARHGYAADAPFITSSRDRSIPLPEMLRYRGDVPSLRAKHCDDDNAKSSGTATIRCSELAVTEHLAVLALRICGDAPPWRASPLLVVVQRVHHDAVPGSVDGAGGASGRPCKPTT